MSQGKPIPCHLTVNGDPACQATWLKHAMMRLPQCGHPSRMSARRELEQVRKHVPTVKVVAGACPHNSQTIHLWEH